MEGGGSHDEGTYSYRTTAQDRSGIGRRECLKLLGVATASVAGVAAESGVARAATGGYGEAGYGEGPYGGGGFSVSTSAATSVDSTSATLDGELLDLDGANSADCYFEWRRTGASSWSTTATETLSSTGSYSASLNGLAEGVEYEYRAVGMASDGDTATGGTTSFTTDDGSTAPSIDSYSVTEAGSPNPHCEITAEWGVSDPDGDLDTVVVDVSDDAGAVVDSATTRVAGTRASGTDEFSIKHANRQTFGVTVTVTDARGDSDSRTWAVTE